MAGWTRISLCFLVRSKMSKHIDHIRQFMSEHEVRCPSSKYPLKVLSYQPMKKPHIIKKAIANCRKMLSHAFWFLRLFLRSFGPGPCIEECECCLIAATESVIGVDLAWVAISPIGSFLFVFYLTVIRDLRYT